MSRTFIVDNRLFTLSDALALSRKGDTLVTARGTRHGMQEDQPAPTHYDISGISICAEAGCPDEERPVVAATISASDGASISGVEIEVQEATVDRERVGTISAAVTIASGSVELNHCLLDVHTLITGVACLPGSSLEANGVVFDWGDCGLHLDEGATARLPRVQAEQPHNWSDSQGVICTCLGRLPL